MINEKLTLEGILDKIYPVGSVYMSISSTDPGDLFGGTWERIKDKFLLSAGDIYSAGATGGSATHYHWQTVGYDGNGLYTEHGAANGRENRVIGASKVSLITSSAQNLQHREDATSEESSLPPYLAVYMWKRTA